MYSDAHLKRIRLVARCFEKLPQHLKDWINNAPFSLHDDYILRGQKAVEKAIAAYEKTGKYHSDAPPEGWEQN
jgi:uncharacterized protein (DUF1015 family)